MEEARILADAFVSSYNQIVMRARQNTACPISARHLFTLVILTLILSACASGPYRYQAVDESVFRARAVVQSAGTVTVKAAVPGEEEAESIFGFPIYDRGIQPIWLEVENRGSDRKRFAPFGTDPAYFSPLEVAYIHRKSFSKQAHSEMEKRLYAMGMSRYIGPGETRSGFVFTNASPGTKSFNVDIFSGQGDGDENFAFFVEVPGFVPDHANIDFKKLYPPGEIKDYSEATFRSMLRTRDCCTTNQSGDGQGLPVGVVMIGPGDDVLRALLRAGWYETAWSANTSDIDMEKAHFLFGRLPDAVFRIQRQGGNDRNELHVWMAPWRVDGEPVWLVLITHFIGQRTQIEQVLFGARFDPDIDEGRNYLIQNIWYSQGLERYAWLGGGEAIPIEQAREDFTGAGYFTDGFRCILWLSGEPMSLLDTTNAMWDDPPAPAH